MIRANVTCTKCPGDFRSTTRRTCDSTPRIKTEFTVFRSPRMGRLFLNHENADEVLDNFMSSVLRLTVPILWRGPVRQTRLRPFMHPDERGTSYMLSDRGIRICLDPPDVPPASVTIQTFSTASRPATATNAILTTRRRVRPKYRSSIRSSSTPNPADVRRSRRVSA